MNLGNTDHALIYSEDNVLNKKSAVIYSGFVVAPGTILNNLIQTKQLQKSIGSFLPKNEIINATDKKWTLLRKETFAVIHEENDCLVRQKARIKYLFYSKNVFKSIKDILEGFRSYKMSTESVELNQLLLASFVILEISDDNFENNRDDELISILTEDANRNYCYNKLDTVTCVTSPFGQLSFFKTVNVSKIANIFGINNCLLIVSAPLVYGCEGGGVYDREQKLIGLVINTTFAWNNETAILSLVADFRSIAREFIKRINAKALKISTIQDAARSKMQNSVVLIQSGGSWGTGCLLSINKKKFVITCAHVITVNVLSTVSCFWNKIEFVSKVIYKNPHYNQPFDIAILDVPDNIPNDCCAECTSDRSVVGDIVYSVGFPYFSTFSTKINSPSIYEGRITKVKKGMLCSDVNVQAGQSGCPLFGVNGKLVGVCISNTKDYVYNLVYPNISMIVPIFDIFLTLSRYSLLEDETILKELESTGDVHNVWGLKPPLVVSKL